MSTSADVTGILQQLAEFDGPLTVRDLARLFGITPKSCYTWIKNNGPQPMRLPGLSAKRFEKTTVARYIRANNPSIQPPKR